MRIRKPKPVSTQEIQNEISSDLIKVGNQKTYIRHEPCPSCNIKDKLRLVSYESGIKGWEAHITCDNCLSTAILNNTGLHFDLNIKAEFKKPTF